MAAEITKTNIKGQNEDTTNIKGKIIGVSNDG